MKRSVKLLALPSLIATSFVLAVTGPSLGQASSTPAFSKSQHAAVLTAMKKYRVKEKVPGLSAAIAIGGRIVLAEGVGWRDVKKQLPATRNTAYRLASISKPITATLLMQLVDQKKIDLDTDARTYVTSFPKKRWPFSCRQLLGHLSGVRHYGGEADPTRSSATLFKTSASAMELFSADPLLQEPGTAYRYSTHAYTVLGAVIESVVGHPFSEHLATAVTGKLSLASLRVERELGPSPELSTIYKTRSTTVSGRDDLSWKEPGGGMVASAPDLALFASKLLNGALISRASRELMWTAQKLPGGKSTKYGLGFGVFNQQGRRVVAHSGSQNGAASYLRIYIDDDTVITVLSNCSGHRIVDLCKTIGTILFPKPRKP